MNSVSTGGDQYMLCMHNLICAYDPGEVYTINLPGVQGSNKPL